MASIKKLSNPFKRNSSGVPFKKELKPNQGRENPNRDVYGTNRWKKLSVAIRTREPLCRMCKSNGELNAAQVVDHIIRINSGGEPWDEDNLQPLCKRCHERKSAIEKHLKST